MGYSNCRTYQLSSDNATGLNVLSRVIGSCFLKPARYALRNIHRPVATCGICERVHMCECLCVHACVHVRTPACA